MREQLAQMESSGKQTDRLIEQATAQAEKIGMVAEAAKTSAQAASQNIEIFISKERARLGIDLKPLDLSSVVGAVSTVNFTVNIHGSTAAFIVEARCSAGEFPLASINENELMDMVMLPILSLPKTVSPHAPHVETYAFLFFGDGRERELILSEIKADRLFVVIRGLINYRDVFDRDRQTGFRYVWKFSPNSPQNSPNRYGAWEKCGPAEQNVES